MPFAQWLQSKMEKHGFSNYRIAKMAGVHQSTVSNWLSGTKPQAEKEKIVRQAISDYELTLSETDSPGIKKQPTVSGGLDAVNPELIEFLATAGEDDLQDVLDFTRMLKRRRKLNER